MSKPLSIRNLLIILVILIGVFVIVKYTSNKGRSKSYRTELVNIDTAKVTRVEISDPEGSTELYKENNEWFVTVGDSRKPAVTTTVKTMLSTLNSIKPSRLAARNEDQWKDFQVDSTGTRVNVIAGKKSAVDIVLGRFGVEGQRKFYTYVRLFEDEDVYVAENFMKMSISTRASDFRNNSVLRLEKDSLISITFNYPDSAIILDKSDDKWYKGQIEADSTTTAKYISDLRFVTSQDFYEEELIGSPDLNVVFGFSDREEIQVSAYMREDQWVIKSSVNENEIFVGSDVFEKIFAPSSGF